MRKAIGILILQLFMVSGLAFGQGVNSTILGRVSDPSGRVWSATFGSFPPRPYGQTLR
jgi:hypothetical protein